MKLDATDAATLGTTRWNVYRATEGKTSRATEGEISRATYWLTRDVIYWPTFHAIEGFMKAQS